MKYTLYALPLVLFTLSSCGGDDPPSTDLELVSFSIDRDTLLAGETVTLTWQTRNATSVTIRQGNILLLNNSDRTSDTLMSNPVDAPVVFTLVATNDALGQEAMQSVEVREVDGIVVSEFVADPMTIQEGDTTTIRWRIGGEVPNTVRITDNDDPDEVLYDGDEVTGTITVQPLTTKTYRIETAGPTDEDDATLTVTVNEIIELPVIDSFSIVQNVIALGDRAQLSWTTSNAETVELRLNDSVVRPANPNGAASGNAQISVNTLGQNTFTLVAANDDGEVSESVTLETLPVPVIDVFTIAPDAYTEASTVATVTWQTRETDTVTLSLNGRNVSSFPTNETSGTFALSLTGRADIEITASNSVAETSQSGTVELGFEEPEPNDSSITAIPIAGDNIPVRGTISSANDQDWYTLIVPQGSLLYARVAYDDTAGCSFDSTLSLYEPDGTTLLGSNDDAPAPIGPCSEIDPIVYSWARNLSAGTYYIVVGGGTNPPNSGTYSLQVDLTPSLPELANISVQAIGNADWRVNEVVSWVGFAGAGPDQGAAYVNGLMSPVHSAAFIETLTFVMDSGVPHPGGYTNELRTALARNGIQNTQTFNAADLAAPRAPYLALTISPTPTSTITGQSIDYADGPLIPVGRFPIRVSVDLQSDGSSLPSAAHNFDLESYNALLGRNDDGDSHHHTFSLYPITELVTGDYEWRLSLTDATGDGWTLQIPITVQ